LFLVKEFNDGLTRLNVVLGMFFFDGFLGCFGEEAVFCWYCVVTLTQSRDNGAAGFLAKA
jgi:hypothetical protein